MNMLKKLTALYAKLPDVTCKGCGWCCVSPTVTLVEFVHHALWCKNNLSQEDFARYLSAKPELHPDHEGNLRCAFIENGRCLVHPGRSGSCRVFGIPSLNDPSTPDLVMCPNNITEVSGQSDKAFMDGWIEQLFDINREIYSFGEAPYYLKGLNLECWFDIYFDTTCDFDIFEPIVRYMHDNVDLSEFASAYEPRTQIREKLDAISILEMLIANADKESVTEAITTIRDSYPFTGTYFSVEADVMLGKLKTLPRPPGTPS